MRGVGWFELPLEIGPPEWRDGQLLIEILHGQASSPACVLPADMMGNLG